LGVPQDLLDHEGVRALNIQKRSGRVANLVEPDLRDLRRIAERVEGLAQVAFVERRQ